MDDPEEVTSGAPQAATISAKTIATTILAGMAVVVMVLLICIMVGVLNPTF